MDELRPHGFQGLGQTHELVNAESFSPPPRIDSFPLKELIHFFPLELQSGCERIV